MVGRLNRVGWLRTMACNIIVERLLPTRENIPARCHSSISIGYTYALYCFIRQVSRRRNQPYLVQKYSNLQIRRESRVANREQAVQVLVLLKCRVKALLSMDCLGMNNEPVQVIVLSTWYLVPVLSYVDSWTWRTRHDFLCQHAASAMWFEFITNSLNCYRGWYSSRLHVL
jgi:hypothetical protein